jgi:hypothetical protein
MKQVLPKWMMENYKLETEGPRNTVKVVDQNAQYQVEIKSRYLLKTSCTQTLVTVGFKKLYHDSLTKFWSKSNFVLQGRESASFRDSEAISGYTLTGLHPLP